MKAYNQNLKLISCEEAIKHIFDYIDKQLKGNSIHEIEYHLETCRHCYDRVEFEKLLKARLKNIKQQIDSDKLRKKIDSLIDSF